MVQTTKNPGEIYPAGVAPSKTDIILFEQEIRQAVTNVEIGKADIANSGKVFPSRESAVTAGQEVLRPALSQIMTREGNFLVVRSASATADDPLFEAAPQWGAVQRIPNDVLLNTKADIANSGKTFVSRAAAVAVGQAALPSALGQIETREGDYLVLRSPTAFADDPLFDEPGPRWGVVMRVPNDTRLKLSGIRLFGTRAMAVQEGQSNLPQQIFTLEGSDLLLRSAVSNTDDPLFGTFPAFGVVQRINSRAAMRDTGTFTLRNIRGTPNVVLADLDATVLAAGGSISTMSTVSIVWANTNTGPVSLEISGQGGPLSVRDADGAVLSGGEAKKGRMQTLRRFGSTWRMVGSASHVDIAQLRNLFRDELAIEAFTRKSAVQQMQGDVARLAGELADGVHRDALLSVSRPGDVPWLYTENLGGGDPYAAPGLSGSASSSEGRVQRIVGAGLVAMRSLVALEPGRVYQARTAVARHINPADPEGATVETRAAWYDRDRTLIDTQPVAAVTDLRVSDGRQDRVVTISRAPGQEVLAPVNARYMRLYVRTYGDDGQTDVQVLEVADLTAAMSWSPDVSMFEGRLAAQESLDAGERLSSLEAAQQASDTSVFASYSEAAAASHPAVIARISVAGRYGPLLYERSVTGTALIAADGSRWAPVGWSTPEHFAATSIWDGETDASAEIARWLDWHIETGQESRAMGRYRLLTPYIREDVASDINLTLGPRGTFIGGDYAHPAIILKCLEQHSNSFTLTGGTVNMSASQFGEAVESGTGLSLTRFSEGRISGMQFVVDRNYADAQINGDSGTTGVDIRRMVLDGCYFRGWPDAGIYWSGNSDASPEDDGGEVIIQNSYFVQCWQAVTLKRSFRKATIKGCYIIDCRGGISALPANGRGPGEEMKILDNWFIRTEFRPVHIYSRGGAVEISRNTFVDWGYNAQGALSGPGAAIDLQGVQNGKIEGNTFYLEQWPNAPTLECVQMSRYQAEDAIFDCRHNILSNNRAIGIWTFLREQENQGPNFGTPDNLLAGVDIPAAFASGGGSWLGFIDPASAGALQFVSQAGFDIRRNGESILP